jgi:hypothetical protein
MGAAGDGEDDCELDSTTVGEPGMVGKGAGEGVSKLITGVGLVGPLDIIASSSSSELSKVRSITGPLAAAGLVDADVVDAVVVIADIGVTG